MISASIKELRAICQYPQPWLLRQLRMVSIYFTWLFLHTPITANGITLLGMAGGILTAVLFSLEYWVTGIGLLFVTLIMDLSDGEVSRYRGAQSKEGSYLDKVYIFVAHPSPFAGLALGVYGIDPNEWVLVAGFVNVISIVLLCIVIEYAPQIAVWKHCRRFVDRLLADPTFLAEQIEKASSVHELSVAPPSAIDRLRNSLFANALKVALAWWDFPHVFVLMMCAIAAHLIIAQGSGVGPMQLFLYFYAVSYPPIIAGMLFKNVMARSIESQFEEEKSVVMSLVMKARREM